MIPPLMVVDDAGKWLVIRAPRYVVRVPKPRAGGVMDYRAGSAVLMADAPDSMPGYPSDGDRYVLARGSRSRAIPQEIYFAPIATPNGFAAAPSGSSRNPSRPLPVAFWDERFRRLADAPGLPVDYAAESPPVSARGGIYLVEQSGLGGPTGARTYWCRPGRRVERVGTAGLVALSPAAKRGVWWRENRTIFALTAGTGKNLHQGKIIWSRPDDRPPASNSSEAAL